MMPSAARDQHLCAYSAAGCETGVMPSDASAMQRPAVFYLNSGEDPMFGEPTLTIAGNVAEVLFAEGVMAELSERLGLTPGFKQHEGHVVPADRLGRLAS